MPTLTEGAILDALRQVQEPELGRDIVTLQMVKGIAIEGSAVAFTIELTTPACPLKDEIEGNTRAVLAELGATDVSITWGAMVRRAAPRQAEQLLPNVPSLTVDHRQQAHSVGVRRGREATELQDRREQIDV